MKHLRTAAIWVVIALAVQLTLAAGLGYAYKPQVQYGTATQASQLNPAVSQVRTLQRQLTQQISVALNQRTKLVTYTPNSVSRNDLLGTYGRCAVGTANYADQYTFPFQGSLATASQKTRETSTSAAIRTAISNLLSALPEYSLDNQDTPRTINLPTLHAKLLLSYDTSVQVSAVIEDPATGLARCFLMSQLQAPSLAQVTNIPGNGGEE